MKLAGFGAIDVTKPYKCTGCGGGSPIWVRLKTPPSVARVHTTLGHRPRGGPRTKPYEFIGFGAMDVTRPYKSIGFGAEGSLAGFVGVRF